ncbi:MAG: hypothetical protein D6690_14640 [Nitrospirae bacterium]|nr:MAG: hypothetical protein D6690_14640 [Nitrospirota bacterium]
MRRNLLSFLLRSHQFQPSSSGEWLAGPWITVHINIEETTATFPRPPLDTPNALYRYTQPLLANQDREYMLLVPLDARYLPLGIHLLSIGTVNYVPAHPREAFKVLINTNAETYALIHNHPHGDPLPSQEDWTFTERFIDISRLMEIPLSEHLVVGHNTYYSFAKESGLF